MMHDDHPHHSIHWEITDADLEVPQLWHLRVRPGSDSPLDTSVARGDTRTGALPPSHPGGASAGVSISEPLRKSLRFAYFAPRHAPPDRATVPTTALAPAYVQFNGAWLLRPVTSVGDSTDSSLIARTSQRALVCVTPQGSWARLTNAGYIVLADLCPVWITLGLTTLARFSRTRMRGR